MRDNEHYDQSTDPIASFYALFWIVLQLLPQSERLEHLNRRANEIHLNIETRASLLRDSIRQRRCAIERARTVWNRDPRNKSATIDPLGLEIIGKLLFHGVLCEARLQELHEDKQTERLAFTQLRKIQSHAWSSISYFEKRCAKAQRVIGFGRFEKKLQKLAQSRSNEFERAQQDLIHPNLRDFYRARAVNATPARLQRALADVAEYKANQIGLPSNWQTLIFKLRAFFYETERTVSPRDVLKVHPRLRDHNHRRGLREQLDVFNISSYLRWVRGWTVNKSVAFAGQIVFPSSADSFETAQMAIRRFSDLFARPNSSSDPTILQ